ncbi:hypothetical protein [Sphingomonas cavernae]|nr:hypothetical protein [Sphingomonas cavernae]
MILGVALTLVGTAGSAQARDAVEPPATIAYDYDFGPQDAGLAGAAGRWSGNRDGRYVDGRYEGTFRGTYQPPVGSVQSAAPTNVVGAYPVGTNNVPVVIRVEPVVTRTVTVVEEFVEPE